MGFWHLELYTGFTWKFNNWTEKAKHILKCCAEQAQKDLFALRITAGFGMMKQDMTGTIMLCIEVVLDIIEP